jgi:hypothetical protein
LALAVPLSRFTSRVGGGSAFFVRLLERMRIFIAIGCGVIQIVLAMKFCPESWEPVVYWALPLFHKIWHPWESGPNPIACFWSLVLNAVIISVAVFWILGLRKKI